MAVLVTLDGELHSQTTMSTKGIRQGIVCSFGPESFGACGLSAELSALSARRSVDFGCWEACRVDTSACGHRRGSAPRRAGRVAHALSCGRDCPTALNSFYSLAPHPLHSSPPVPLVCSRLPIKKIQQLSHYDLNNDHSSK
jgi:hypothetical protein